MDTESGWGAWSQWAWSGQHQQYYRQRQHTTGHVQTQLGDEVTGATNAQDRQYVFPCLDCCRVTFSLTSGRQPRQSTSEHTSQAWSQHASNQLHDRSSPTGDYAAYATYTNDSNAYHDPRSGDRTAYSSDLSAYAGNTGAYYASSSGYGGQSAHAQNDLAFSSTSTTHWPAASDQAATGQGAASNAPTAVYIVQDQPVLRTGDDQDRHERLDSSEHLSCICMHMSDIQRLQADQASIDTDLFPAWQGTCTKSTNKKL